MHKISPEKGMIGALRVKNKSHYSQLTSAYLKTTEKAHMCQTLCRSPIITAFGRVEYLNQNKSGIILNLFQRYGYAPLP